VAPPPKPQLASGGWKVRPQTPAFLLPLTAIVLSKYFSSVNLFYYFQKYHRSNKQQMLCFCFFRAFATIFHFKLNDDKYLAPPEISFAPPHPGSVVLATALALLFLLILKGACDW